MSTKSSNSSRMLTDSRQNNCDSPETCDRIKEQRQDQLPGSSAAIRANSHPSPPVFAAECELLPPETKKIQGLNGGQLARGEIHAVNGPSDGDWHSVCNGGNGHRKGWVDFDSPTTEATRHGPGNVFYKPDNNQQEGRDVYISSTVSVGTYGGYVGFPNDEEAAYLNPASHSTTEEGLSNGHIYLPQMPTQHTNPKIASKNNSPSFRALILGTVERLVKFMIVVVSVTTIVISVYVLNGCSQHNTQAEVLSPYELIRLPCKDLSELFPIVELHEYTDAITNRRFEEAHIQRLKTDDGDDCQLPTKAIFAQITSQRDTNLVQAQVNLAAANKGPDLEYSNYNLSITKAEVSNVKTDRFSIIIQYDGLYFVYYGLQLTYGTEAGKMTCRDVHFKTSVTHLIRKRLDSVDPQTHRAILRSEHTCCIKCNEESSTDYTGGMFYLAEGDELFIQVSAPKVIGADGQNYLGIFQLKQMNLTTGNSTISN